MQSCDVAMQQKALTKLSDHELFRLPNRMFTPAECLLLPEPHLTNQPLQVKELLNRRILYVFVGGRVTVCGSEDKSQEAATTVSEPVLASNSWAIRLCGMCWNHL